MKEKQNARYCIGCIGCEMCVQECQHKAITMQQNKPVVNKGQCSACMMCVEICPTGAMWDVWCAQGVNCTTRTA